MGSLIQFDLFDKQQFILHYVFMLGNKGVKNTKQTVYQ